MGVGYNPKIVTDGLVLCLDAANPKSYNYNIVTYSQDFTNAAYSKSTGLISATGVLAPDSTLTATTMTDDDAANWESFGRSFTVPNDSTSYNISIYIRKTTGATSTRTGFNVSFTGGTTKSYNIRFNADTGVAAGGDSNLVTSENNNFWRLSFTVSNNSTGNTSLNISYYPATGIYDGGDVATVTGSHTVWGFQVTRGATLLPYRINVNDSTATWTDLSSRRTSNLINRPSFSNDAIVTNDLNSYISIPYNANERWTPRGSVGSSQKTIEIWFKSSDATGGCVVTAPWNGSGGYNYQIFPSIWYLANINYNYGGIVNQSYAVNLIDGANHQLVCWVNSTNMGYYIDGGKYSGSQAHGITIDVGASGVNSQLPTAIGTTYPYGEGWAGSAGSNLEGSYYVCRIYNKVLSAAEIKQNFNATRGRFGI